MRRKQKHKYRYRDNRRARRTFTRLRLVGTKRGTPIRKYGNRVKTRNRIHLSRGHATPSGAIVRSHRAGHDDTHGGDVTVLAGVRSKSYRPAPHGTDRHKRPRLCIVFSRDRLHATGATLVACLARQDRGRTPRFTSIVVAPSRDLFGRPGDIVFGRPKARPTVRASG